MIHQLPELGQKGKKKNLKKTASCFLGPVANLEIFID